MARRLDRGHEPRQELMRQNENEQSRLIARLGQIGYGHDVIRKPDPGQILDVLVLVVDHLGQLPGGAVFQFDVLLEDPHVDPGLARVEPGAVTSDEGGDGRSPVAAPDYAHAVVLLGAVLRVGVHDDVGIVGVHFFVGLTVLTVAVAVVVCCGGIGIGILAKSSR